MPRDENEEAKCGAQHHLIGQYANYFKIGHNAREFVLDFGQLYPDENGIKFHTRIIMGPAYVMALRRTLDQSIEEYETTHRKNTTCPQEDL